MNDQNTPISKTWRTKVTGILREGKVGTVFIKQRARRDWASLTSCPFDSALREVIAEALEDEGLIGKKYEMDEPGETYGFIFQFRSVAIYAKVNLTIPEEVVIIYSAHRPLKGDELL
jgi:hypothetical protein